jgi:hypothetical protein
MAGISLYRYGGEPKGTARVKPPPSQLNARSKPRDWELLSCVPRVFLVCSSCSHRVLIVFSSYSLGVLPLSPSPRYSKGVSFGARLLGAQTFWISQMGGVRLGLRGACQRAETD